MKNRDYVLTHQTGEGGVSFITLRSIDGPIKDILGAVKAAAADYAKTAEGKMVTEREGMTWGSFLRYAPNSICAQHGFIKMSPDAPPEVHQINLEEPLLSEDTDELHPFKCPFCGSTNTKTDYYDGEAKAEMRDCHSCLRSYIVWDSDCGEPETVTDTMNNEFPLISRLIEMAKGVERLLLRGDEEVEVGENGEYIAIWAYSSARGNSRLIMDAMRVKDVNLNELTKALVRENITFVL